MTSPSFWHLFLKSLPEFIAPLHQLSVKPSFGLRSSSDHSALSLHTCSLLYYPTFITLQASGVSEPAPSQERWPSVMKSPTTGGIPIAQLSPYFPVKFPSSSPHSDVLWMNTPAPASFRPPWLFIVQTLHFFTFILFFSTYSHLRSLGFYWIMQLNLEWPRYVSECYFSFYFFGKGKENYRFWQTKVINSDLATSLLWAAELAKHEPIWQRQRVQTIWKRWLSNKPGKTTWSFFKTLSGNITLKNILRSKWPSEI